jgi:methionyl-tRNA synthetase
MNQQDLNNYIKQVVEFSFEANKYFNDLQPWALKKTDLNRMNTILFSIVLQIKNISILLSPIIPISSNKILDILNLKNEDQID